MCCGHNHRLMPFADPQPHASHSRRRTMSAHKSYGILVGLLVFLSYIDLGWGLPVTVVALLAGARFRAPRASSFTAACALALIAFSAAAIVFKQEDSLRIVLPILFSIIVLGSSIVTSYKKEFIEGMLVAAGSVLILDFLANLSFVLTNVDVFGRVVDIRADGFQRLNGILGHPYLSVAVSVIGMSAGIFLKNRPLIFIAILNLFLNETGRSRIVLALLVAWLVHQWIFKRERPLIGAVIIAACAAGVYYLTLTSTDPSNILRSAAWFNSMEEILQSPWTGHSHYQLFDRELGVNEDTLKASGVAENQYLDVALHFGIPLSILYFLLLSLAYIRACRASRHFPSNAAKAATLLSFIVLADSLWGNLAITSAIAVYLTVMVASTQQTPYPAGLTSRT